MSAVDLLFDSIARFSLLAFLLLGATTLGLRFLNQPLERIRFIQISLVCVFLTGLLSHARWRPSIDLPVLPPSAWRSVLEPSTAGPAFDVHAGSTMSGVEAGSPADDGLRTREPPGQTAAVSMSSSVLRTVGPRWDWMQLTRRSLTIGFLGLTVFQIGYLLFGYAATRRLLAGAKPLSEAAAARVGQLFATMSDRSDIRFATSAAIQVPMVHGVLRPLVLLPPNLAAENADELTLRHSLAHEWKHIDGLDLATWQLVTLCQVFFWPQPFYWILRRELRVSQDQIADEFAARQIGQKAAYAQTLVTFSRTRQYAMHGALSMAGTRSNLFRRVEMLLNDNFQVSTSTRLRVVAGCATVMVLGGVALASLRLTHAAPADHPLERETVEDSSSERSDPAKEEPAQSVEHAGHVFDATTGKPIPGATVIVTRMNSGDWRELAVTESTTDANGKYTFTIPPEQLKQRLLYIMFDLRHEDYAPRHCGSYSYGMIQKNLQLGAEPWFTRLEMVPGSKTRGRLVDEAGKPVAGAQLRGNSSDPSAGDRVGTSWVEAASDEEGRFEVMMTRDGTAGLSIIPLDHCLQHIDLGSQRGDLGDIVLAGGLSIRGRVLDAAGQPMEGLWVNLTPVDVDRSASYEMKRSSESKAGGEFRTRPLTPGEYTFEVETKATGAIEKARYANFHDSPPPAMFVRQVIEVSADGVDKPYVIQAVPHVLISGQCYDSAGEVRAIHSPYATGRFNDQHVWIRAGRNPGVGAFELMVPHGFQDVSLRFMTNEHSALTVQFVDQPVRPQSDFRFPTIEEDISGIRVVRYVAPILQAKVVDESGETVNDARIWGRYLDQSTATEETSEMIDAMTSLFELRSNGLYQSSSLVPDFELEVIANKDDLKSEPVTLQLTEGENRVITLELK